MCIRDSVYTEWYPSKGYNFNITNSTQYDQYYVSGRNIFTNISRIVDDIFNTYLRRVGDFAPVSYTHLDVYKRQERYLWTK